MNKFNRNYELRVQKVDGDILFIRPPFTIEFDIQKNNLGSANHASIRIYNLSKNNRSAIRFDINNVNVFRSVTLKAGYGDDLSTIFNGNISQAWSIREGNNFITEIQSLDGGYALLNSVSNQTFADGATTGQIIRALFNDFSPTVSIGAIGSYPMIPRGSAYSGATKDLINQLTGQGFFINDNKAYALGDGDYIPGQLAFIDSESGLLGTPMLQNTIVSVDMIFEPRLIMYQSVFLNSRTAGAVFNKTYKVIGINHRGMISPSVCGTAVSHVTLSPGIINLVQVT